MKENFIDKLPLKIIYSFQSLIEELERSEYNFGEFKAFLEYLKATRPELIDGVETFEDFQKIIKDVEPIIEKIIPKPFVKYNLKAITFPFSDKFIFATDRLKELIDNNESRLKFNFEDLDYDTFKDYSNLFISFIDRLSDASKWKQIHTNIRILTANMQKMVKSINSIDLQKAAALEVNVKQLSDRSNINYIKQVIEEFVNLFGVITQAQYNNQVMFANTMGSFGQTLQQTQTVPGMVQNQKNQENQKELNKIKSGETSIVIDNFKDKNQQKAAREFDTNNDGVINSSDNLDNIGNKLDKLIAIMMAYNSPFSRK